jgi:hypothetical protein
VKKLNNDNPLGGVSVFWCRKNKILATFQSPHRYNRKENFQNSMPPNVMSLLIESSIDISTTGIPPIKKGQRLLVEEEKYSGGDERDGILGREIVFCIDRIWRMDRG